MQSLCEQTEKRPLAGLVVIGNGQAARAISLAGTSMQLPVLWAKGGVANLHGTSGEVSIFIIQNLHFTPNELILYSFLHYCESQNQHQTLLRYYECQAAKFCVPLLWKSCDEFCNFVRPEIVSSQHIVIRVPPQAVFVLCTDYPDRVAVDS